MKDVKENRDTLIQELEEDMRHDKISKWEGKNKKERKKEREQKELTNWQQFGKL